MSKRLGALNLIRRFLWDEEGQSTTEYILILAVVLIVAKNFRGFFQQALFNLSNKVEADIKTFE